MHDAGKSSINTGRHRCPRSTARTLAPEGQRHGNIHARAILAKISPIADDGASLRSLTPPAVVNRKRREPELLGSALPTHSVEFPKPALAGGLNSIQSDRDRLTQLLRGLAAELDELDRQICDINWQRGRPAGSAIGEMLCQRTDLETKREKITARLHVMAAHLNRLDTVLSDLRRHDQPPTARVGTCPHCGYPSLGSGMCAYCRPNLLSP